MAIRHEVHDVRPRELADGLAMLVERIGEEDREIAAILRRAQRDLEALSWNRWASVQNRARVRRTFHRHHKALMPIRAR